MCVSQIKRTESYTVSCAQLVILLIIVGIIYAYGTIPTIRGARDIPMFAPI
jgi:hypothetical protein